MKPESGSTPGLLALALSLASPLVLSAQLTLGIGAGLVSSSLTGVEDDVVVMESETGLNFGGWLSIPVGGRVSLVPGVHYVQKGATGTDPGYATSTVEIDYVEVPLFVAVSLSAPGSGVGFSLFVGPNVAVEARCNLSATLDEATISSKCDPADEDERRTVALGAVLGGGVQVPMAPTLALVLQGGADFGLRSLDAGPDPSNGKFRAFFAMLGLAFTLGG